MVSIREMLDNPAIPYQPILLTFSGGVFAFEFYLRSVSCEVSIDRMLKPRNSYV